MDKIKYIGFDADDTLWINGSYFKKAEDDFCQLLSDYLPKEDLLRELFITEMKNMDLYGYGAMAFTLSLIETAIRISDKQISASVINDIYNIGTSILKKPVELLPGVNEVLPKLSKSYKLILITKGDLLDQERKLEKSGLYHYFHHVEVLSEKNEKNYKSLIELLNISPEEFIMVGNSIKSDIVPVLKIGAKAIHIPQNDVWSHENSIKPEQEFFEFSSLFSLMELFGPEIE